MTRQLDVDRLLESWLAEGPSDLPDRVVQNIFSQLEETHQRKHLWLPGREQMNRMMMTAGGLAAIALLVVVGIYFVGHGSGIGNQTTPSPTPTPAPTALPTSGAVLPGRYFVDHFGYRYTFTVSGDGWTIGVNPPEVIITKGDITGTDFANLWLGWSVDPTQVVWGTACAWPGTGFTPGPSVDDLTSALAGLSGFESTQPTSVTVAGYSGKELKLTVPGDANFASCGQGEYRSWDGRYYQKPGQTDDVRVLNLDGHRTLIFTTRFAGTPAGTLAEQSSMFDSLEISPTPATPTSTP